MFIQNNKGQVKQLDNFELFLDQPLGMGSFGKVYKGRETQNNKLVAIKQIDKQRILGDLYLRKAFQKEVSIQKKLKSPNIVAFIDLKETQKNYYIIQEFCHNGDFRKLLLSKKQISESEALSYFKQLLTGFLQLLKNGIIHRDLKPENILVENNLLKLGDFGLARTVEYYFNEQLKSFVGTPTYMSPQIINQQKYTTKCDIWAFGIIFYEMMHGRVPWNGSSPQEISKKQQTMPLTINKNISSQAKDLIQKCLVINEKDRISWEDLYNHPLFNDYFKQNSAQNKLENKSKFAINKIKKILYKQKEDLKQYFNNLQLNKDQKLEKTGFAEFLKKLGDFSEEEAQYIFNKFDKNKDGQIDYQEFQMWIQKNQTYENKDDNNNNEQQQKQINNAQKLQNMPPSDLNQQQKIMPQPNQKIISNQNPNIIPQQAQYIQNQNNNRPISAMLQPKPGKGGRALTPNIQNVQYNNNQVNYNHPYQQQQQIPFQNQQIQPRMQYPQQMIQQPQPQQLQFNPNQQQRPIQYQNIQYQQK